MSIAVGVQRRLFPSNALRVPGFDISGRAFPADSTCGDYYDYLRISDNCLGIVIADVRGHGVGPALVMAQTRAYLRAFSRFTLNPSEILCRINNMLSADLETGHFVTMVLVFLDLQSGSLVYANAGHPSAYIFDRDGNVRCHLKSTGLPLGLFPDCDFGTCRDLGLAPGDLLMMLTDGLLECESSDEQEFGVARTHEVIARHHQAEASVIVDALHAAACSFTNRHRQEDDMTFVVCRRLAQDEM